MQEFPRTLKIATVWLLLGLAVFLGFRALEAQREVARMRQHRDEVGDLAAVLDRQAAGGVDQVEVADVDVVAEHQPPGRLDARVA
uniref:hypothetical protein n=1 Tax=Salmonella enterica TaxID=28901 RepID=UPI003FA7B7D9